MRMGDGKNRRREHITSDVSFLFFEFMHYPPYFC